MFNLFNVLLILKALVPLEDLDCYINNLTDILLTDRLQCEVQCGKDGTPNDPLIKELIFHPPYARCRKIGNKKQSPQAGPTGGRDIQAQTAGLQGVEQGKCQ